MRFILATLFATALLSGCASSPARPSAANVLAARAREAISPSSPSPEAVLPTRRIPLIGAACPLSFPPRDVGSVVRIPANMMSKAMDPVMHAVCACTKPGEYSTVVAEIDLGRGSAHVRARESSTIHECLETLHVTFDPIPESELPGSDCINCGPRYYGVFVDSPPPPKKDPDVRLIYSFLLDRSSEVLNCIAGTHAEKGSCRPDVTPESTTPPKKTCGCTPTDLACAIACAGAK
jgi:hypothetical protein